MNIPGNRETLYDLFREEHPLPADAVIDPTEVNRDYEVLGPVIYDEDMPLASSSMLGNVLFPSMFQIILFPCMDPVLNRLTRGTQKLVESLGIWNP